MNIILRFLRLPVVMKPLPRAAHIILAAIAGAVSHKFINQKVLTASNPEPVIDVAGRVIAETSPHAQFHPFNIIKYIFHVADNVVNARFLMSALSWVFRRVSIITRNIVGYQAPPLPQGAEPVGFWGYVPVSQMYSRLPNNGNQIFVIGLSEATMKGVAGVVVIGMKVFIFIVVYRVSKYVVKTCIYYMTTPSRRRVKSTTTNRKKTAKQKKYF